MNKKFISALLFGAMAIASTSTFVSCKDYDDDITELRSEIDKNAKDLSSLVDQKINNVNSEIASLRAQAEALDAAYKAADAALQTAIANAETNAKEYAKLMADDAKSHAEAKAAAAEAAAKSHAEVQAAQAQAAAIAAAQQMVNEAKVTLEAALTIANAKIDEQGKTIASLLEADKTLSSAITAAQAKADQAYALAEQAKKLAEDAQASADTAQKAAEAAQKTADAAVKAAADAQAAADKAQASADKAAADAAKAAAENAKAAAEAAKAAAEAKTAAADAAKVAAENLAAAQKNLNEAIAGLKTTVENLQSQVTVLGEKVSALETSAQKNAADIAAQAKVLEDLKASNAAAIKAIEEQMKAANDAQDKATQDAIKAVQETLIAKIEANAAQIEALKGAVEAAKAAADAAVTTAKAYTDSAVETIMSEITKSAQESAAYTDEKVAEAMAAAAEAKAAAEAAAADAAKALETALAEVAKAQAAADEALAELEKLASKDDLENAKTTITAAQTAADNAQAAANNAQAAADNAQAAADKALEAAGTALNDAKAADAELEKRIQEKIDAISGDLTALKTAYQNADTELKTEINGQITAINDDITTLKTDVNNKISSINAAIVFQAGKLKSLVFNPELYYQGIEAVGVYSFNYTAIVDLKKANVETDQTSDRLKHSVKPEDEISVVPDVTFSYYLNPSNAVVSKDVKNYNFLLNNAAYTRAAKKSDFSINEINLLGGMVNVTASLKNADNISDINNDNKVDVIALQYTDKNANDTIITSDFAALKHYVISDFAINKVNGKGKVDFENVNVADNHLPTSAQQAIANGPLFEIAYTGDEIDFDEWINVHYNAGNGDQLWGGQETVGKKNFELVYELIGYKAGSNNTSESEHAAIDPETNVLTTKGYNNDVTPAIIGRTPLVRVTLVDHNSSDRVAAVGYMLIEITPIKVDDIYVGPYEKTNNYQVYCDPAGINLGKMLSWDQVENDILAEVGLSRAQFDALYELDADANGVAYQYKNTKGDLAAAWGEVKETSSDSEDHMTDVLTWSVTNNEAYSIFKNTNNVSKSVIVRFKPSSAADIDVRPYIYVTLTWKPKDRWVAPYASISDENKVYATWYAKDKNEVGKSDLHAHVMEAKSGNQDVFDFSVEKSTFMDGNGNLVKPVDLIKASLRTNGYRNIANSCNVIYEFVGPDYKKAGSAKQGSADYYELQVNEYKTELQARRNNRYAWTTIAVLDQVTGEIEYLKNDISEDILNYVAHNKLAAGESLTAKVQMVASTCDPASKVALTNNVMFVKFLRPLNVDGTKVTVVDADPSTHTIELGKDKKAMLNFTDWRDFNNDQVVNSSNNTTDIFTFYGVKSIKQNTSAKVLSNFADGVNFKALSSDEFVFTYTLSGAPTATSQGTITYEKKTTVAIHEFIAKIPVVVEYDWGTLYATIDVTVKPTVNNAKEHNSFK